MPAHDHPGLPNRLAKYQDHIRRDTCPGRRLADGRWVLTGGGGYDLANVVPRTWAHLIAEAADEPIDPGTPTPAGWRDYVACRTGLAAPGRMTDGTAAEFEPFESGLNPGHPVDRAIMATRNAVFPLHGLMPL